MAFPDPVPGLVIAYAYLWRDEARRGLEEGKDRPCVIVLTVQNDGGRTIVPVAPITHSPPDRSEFAVEIPGETKRRLRLDCEQSWIIAADLNRFVWPGVDLRPTRQASSSHAFGLPPPAVYREVRDKVLALARVGHAALAARSE